MMGEMGSGERFAGAAPERGPEDLERLRGETREMVERLAEYLGEIKWYRAENGERVRMLEPKPGEVARVELRSLSNNPSPSASMPQRELLLFGLQELPGCETGQPDYDFETASGEEWGKAEDVEFITLTYVVKPKAAK